MKYRGILAKKLPPDPSWSAIRTFSNLRNIASIQPAGQATSDDNLSGLPRDEFASPDLAARIDALYKFHGVEWGDDDALLFALVTTHVTGLKMEAKRGPETKWSEIAHARLRVAVDERVAKGRSISNACQMLATKPEWSSMLGKSKKPGVALRKQYNLAQPAKPAKQYWRSRLPELDQEFEQKLNKWAAWAAAHPEQAAEQLRYLPEVSKLFRARKNKKR